ncbi:uncharacterized protein LOC120356029, partial [Nilaparvata lugens]|uniref:uncharacterized protein LOC120356029 n=1 Tax=Nilaparvata lugens TaxID=108931 RepID=UPI00193EB458
MRWHRLRTLSSSRILIDPELIIKNPVDDEDFLYKVPSAKQCYNTTEKTLDFFQYYTQQNCLMECSTKRALRECGCVLFYMPHNESTYICSDEYSSCAMNIVKATHYDTGERKFVDDCDCLPSCNYTDYKVISYESVKAKSDLIYPLQELWLVFRDDFFHPKVRTYTYNNNEMMDATVFYLDAFLGDLLELFNCDYSESQENQLKILDGTVNHPLVKKYPLKLSYQQYFLKLIVKK